MGDAPSVNK